MQRILSYLGTRLLFPIITMLIAVPSYAQLAIEWQKTLGGSGYDYSNSIELGHDSGYVLIGSTFSSDGNVTGNHGGGDAWVVRLDNNGNLMWQKCLGGTRKENGYKIKATSDGGYIVITSAASYDDGNVGHGHGQNDFWLVKLDGSGNIEWQKTYGGSGVDAGISVIEAPSGGYVACGYTISTDGDVTGLHLNFGPNGIRPDCWVIKVDDTGKLLWQKTYGGGNDDEAVAIAATNDGGYIFTGLTMSSDGDVSYYHGGTSEGGDCWVVKINDTGAIMWEKTFGGTMEDQGFDIMQSRDGHYIVGASSVSFNEDFANSFGQADAWILNLNDTGGTVWIKNYGTSGSEYVTAIRQTEDDGFVFCGWNSDAWLVKTDAMGNQLWQHSYGGSGSDNAWGMQLTNDGGCIITGATTSHDGDVTGVHDTTYGDIWTVKLKPLVGVHEVSNNKSPVEVYPTITSGTIHVNLPVGYEDPEVVLYNMLGQKMTITDNVQGLNHVINIQKAAAGTYILEVKGRAERNSYMISYQP